MSLVRLSIASVMACLIGLGALLVVAVVSLERMQRSQQEVVALFELRERLDELSAASDALLLHGADPVLWRAYRGEAHAIQRELGALAERQPDAARASHLIDLVLDALEAREVEARQVGAREADAREAPRGAAAGLSGAGGGVALAPLDVPEMSRALMTQVSGHGIALDTAIGHLLRERERALGQRAMWIRGGFAAAALAFGLACVAAFTLMHRRLSGPIRSLSDAIQRNRLGETQARARVSGDDELARLAAAFNGLADQREDAMAELERSERMLAESQRIAAVGSWRLHLADMTLEWSDETYRIVGVDRACFTPTPDAFLARVHPEDLAGLRAERDRALGTRGVHEIEFRLRHGDGEVRHVQERARIEPGPAGEPLFLTGTIQDITERRRLTDNLHQYRRLIEASSDHFCIIDADHHYTLCNAGYAHLMQRERSAIEGRPVAEVLGARFYQDEVRAPVDRCLAGRPQAFEAERLYPHLGPRQVLIRYYPIASPDGVIRHAGMVMTDVTELKRAEAELREQRQFLAMAGRIARLGGWAMDLPSGPIRLSEVAAEIHGKPHGYAPGFDEAIAFYAPEHREPILRLFRACAEQGRAYDHEVELVDARGERRWVRAAGEPVHDEDGTLVRVQGALQDISAMKATERELARVLETRQTLINALPAHIALLDASGRILDVNDQWRQFGRDNGLADPALGIGASYLAVCKAAASDGDEDAAQAHNGLRAVLSGTQQRYALEYACHAPNQARWFRFMASRLGGAGQPGAVVMHIDVTERKLAERELNRMAYEDALTGLVSRNGFVRRLEERIDAAGWQPDACVVVLDVRQQRDINDAHGYAAGDELLRQIGQRLEQHAGDGAVVGRIGGDEFAVLLPEHADAEPAQRRAAVARTFTEPFALDRLKVEAGATFGYTVLGSAPRDTEDLLREAELALFQSRRGDSGEAWVEYTSVLHDEARRRTRIARELRQALEADEFQLRFQPKVDLRDGRLIGCEALLRWLHPEQGLLAPGAFIPVAERSRLIGPIGEWVIHEACRCLRAWQREGLDVVRVALNVSLIQFTTGDLPDILQNALAEHEVAPGALTLEITESVFERESETLLAQLRTLHEMGVRLSLDDFGTGYSSLLYLQKYPFDEIKIDRGFVGRMLEDEYSRNIVATVLGIAGGLGAEAVAEGVETAAVRDALLDMGCDLGQGFYYSLPLDARELRRVLERGARLPMADA